MTKASGTFEVKLTPLEDAMPEGLSFGAMTFDKSFSGPLTATSKGIMLTAMTEVQGSAGYVALETITGTLDGREGGFNCQHLGTMDKGAQSLSLVIVPDSGTEALAGIRGTMNIRIEEGQHYYDIDYTLPE
ncbi:MAG: DUF3224 domain-containing protein [Alphaproteobacteria bacterium]|nr:DUF3224 domain-containing protein [Alphaproteobacteria bacterium]